MKYSKEEILTIFKDKECLYKENQRIINVLIHDIKVDDWGVKFNLKTCNSKQAVNIYGDLEYEEKPEELNTSFIFSGAWDIINFRDMIVHVTYISGELNTDPETLHFFKNNETNFYKLWKRF